MKIKLDPTNPQTWPEGRVNTVRLDATTESELAAQQASDDDIAMRDLTKTKEGNQNLGGSPGLVHSRQVS